MNAVISRENHYLYANTSFSPYSFEVEHALLRVLEQEMDNERHIEAARSTLWHCEAFNEEALFTAFDKENKGYLSLQDLHTIISVAHPDLDWSNCERAFRKLDEDNDKKISFQEFLRSMRPIYCYKKYEHYVPVATNQSSAKLYYTAKEPAPLRKKSLSKTQVSSQKKTVVATKNTNAETEVIESKGVQIDRPYSVYQKWNYDDPNKVYRTRTMFNDNHWILDHPAYWSSGPWWNYPVAYEQQNWLDHPYHAHRRFAENQKNNEIEAPEVPTKHQKLKTLPQRNKEASPQKKSMKAMRNHLGYSPEKRRVWKRDDLLDTGVCKAELLPEQETFVETMAPIAIVQAKEEHPVEMDIVKYTEPPGKITEELKRAFIMNMQECLNDQKILEEKRINLALRFDFCVGEFFQQFDNRKTGYINLNDLWTYSKFSAFTMNKEDWCILLDRFDRDRDAHMNLIEFSEVFYPTTKGYRSKMAERSRLQGKAFRDFTIQTQKLVKDLLYSIVKAEENFEINKFRISGGSVTISNQIYDWIDANANKLIGFDEFSQTLQKNGVKANIKAMRAVFDQFDKDKNGNVSFAEFHTPIKNDVEYFN